VKTRHAEAQKGRFSAKTFARARPELTAKHPGHAVKMMSPAFGGAFFCVEI
jgi:hypothetical protein